MGVLYVVATPIGNMDDLSPRARATLATVDLIAAEDTRHTGAMLKRLGIDTPLLSNHGFNERARLERLLGALAGGDVALVSDAGTPAISDPGALLVRAAADAGYAVVPIPGPSSVTAAISASGLVEGPFTFLGFLPRTAGEREDLLTASLRGGLPLIVFESANRIEGLVALLANRAPSRHIVVFRELTKLHEEAIRGTAEQLPDLVKDSVLKGEFVVVIEGGAEDMSVDLDQLIERRIELGGKPTDIAREIARETGMSRSDIYERILIRLKRAQGA
jgi:16S rRNA (cytidine1402-2'-O)-methyltransferase